MNRMRQIFVCVFFTLKLNAQVHTDSASIYFNLKQYEKAISYCEKGNDYYLLSKLGNELFEKKDYNNSLEFYLKTLEIGSPFFNETNKKIILNLIAHNYQSLYDYVNAEKYYKQLFELNSKSSGDLNESNIKILNGLIAVSDAQKKFKESYKYYLNILEIQENKFGEFHPDFVKSLFNTAWALVDAKELDKAEKYFLRAISIESKITDTNSIEYAKCLNNLTVFYSDYKFDYKKSESYLKQVIEIKKNAIGYESNDYLDSYEKLGFLYEKQNKLEDALKVFNEILEKRKITKNKSYIVTFGSLVRLKCVINNTVDFDTIEKLCRKYLVETDAILGKSDVFYQFGMMYLVSFYEKNDIYYLAEKEQNELINLKKNILHQNIDQLFSDYEFLANIYEKMSNHKLAESIHKFILDKKIENKVTKDEIASSYNNLACVYMNEFEYKLALTNFLKSIDIIKKEYSEERKEYGTYLSNLGLLYIKLNNFIEAEKCLLKSIEIIGKNQNQFDENYLIACTNLGALYKQLGRCQEAIKYYNIAINNCSNKNSINYKYRFLNLAVAYHCMDSIDKEKECLKTSSKYFQIDIENTSYDYTSSNRDQLLSGIIRSRNFPLTFLARDPKHSDIVELAINEDLLLNHLSINNEKRIKKFILNSSDNELKSNYSLFMNYKKIISNKNELKGNNHSIDYDNLIIKTDSLEKQLIQKSREFSRTQKSLSTRWNDLKNNLNDNEIIIDIVSFEYEKNNSFSDSILYGAFLIDKIHNTPKFVILFEEKQLKYLLSNRNIQSVGNIENLYLNKRLFDLIFKPILNELRGINSIYLSLSGLTHQINFAALPFSDSTSLGEKFQLHIYNTPVQVTENNNNCFINKENTEIILYGGIDYNSSRIQAIDNNTEDVKGGNYELESRSGINKFGYLIGSSREVDSIKNKALSNGYVTKIFNEQDATEESFKRLDGRSKPFILHLATHGFFFPDSVMPNIDLSLEQVNSNVFALSEDPMIRSGIILAGANNYWGKKNAKVLENGIMTASEISNLDLSSCELVVLSACETGLGKINGSEGVFGLQRAFKMAGVKNIIMSLWKIPDAQTAEYFEYFYDECFSGKSIGEAFKLTQIYMKAKYSPYYWAGFVLLE